MAKKRHTMESTKNKKRNRRLVTFLSHKPEALPRGGRAQLRGMGYNA